MLLTCLAGMLLFAVIFYEYIPNRKVVPEVAVYNASEKIKELKSDDIDKRNQTIIKTFEVTSSDLTNYKIANDYVPGKSNPFGSKTTNPDAGSSTKKSGNTIDTNTGTTKNIKTADGENTTEEDTENVITTK
jgi:hypothetical protein